MRGLARSEASVEVPHELCVHLAVLYESAIAGIAELEDSSSINSLTFLTALSEKLIGVGISIAVDIYMYTPNYIYFLSNLFKFDLNF